MTEIATVKEEIYLFNRDDFERQRQASITHPRAACKLITWARLNKQHGLLKRLCRGNLLDPQIPKGKVHRVADIGTGTGIWLDDVAADLASASAADREYTGFDISRNHFPVDKPGMRFLEHDVLKPFPEEFHSQYDLVHIRFLVLALKKEDFKTAASNVAALLKPGGYFQWEEIETKNMHFMPPSEITARVRSIMRNAAQLNGLTNTPCAEILRNLTALGFADVRVEDYDSASREDLAAEAREWTKAGAKAGLYYALLRDGSGRTQEETRTLADELLEKYVGEIDSGVLPTLPLEMVVGRKL